jgi:CheY-like chemotaxis protein
VHAEVLHAWLVFLRSDIASNVAAMNDRLTSIRDAVRELDLSLPSPGPEVKDALETIGDDVDRIVAVLQRLAQRVGNVAPDAIPLVIRPLAEVGARAAHILVVEDDDAVRGAIARLLIRLGHQVTSCSNGVEALQVLELGLVDCVVSDFRMPALGGRGFFEQVEEQWPTLASRFVFVTGDVADPRTLEFLKRTAQPVVTKPYEVKELIAAIATVLAQAGLVRPSA